MRLTAGRDAVLGIVVDSSLHPDPVLVSLIAKTASEQQAGRGRAQEAEKGLWGVDTCHLVPRYEVRQQILSPGSRHCVSSLPFAVDGCTTS